MKYTSTTTLLITFLFLFQINPSQAQTANDLIGTWLTSDGKSKVEIIKDPETRIFMGTIIWLKKPSDKEGNPTLDPNGQAVMGMKILNNFKFDGDEWANGDIYDPEHGDEYYCNITLVNDNKIKVRGSLDPMGWVGRTVYWKRVVE